MTHDILIMTGLGVIYILARLDEFLSVRRMNNMLSLSQTLIVPSIDGYDDHGWPEWPEEDEGEHTVVPFRHANRED